MGVEPCSIFFGAGPPEGSRFQRNRFADYLRLLDARSAGTSLAAMAERLYPNDEGDVVDRVRKQPKKAEAMRDGGYRDLLLWSSKVTLPEYVQSIPDRLGELALELWDIAESTDKGGFDEVMAEFQHEVKKRAPPRRRRPR